MFRNALQLFALVSMSGAWLGCGGDDSAPAAITTGLPAQEKLSEVKGSDAAMVCAAFRDGVQRIVPQSELQRLTCTSAALTQSITATASANQQASVTVDVAKCDDLVAKCERGESIGSESGQFDFSTAFSGSVDCSGSQVEASLAKCNATVGDFEACLNTTLQSFGSFFGAFTCAAFKDPVAAEKQFSNLPKPELSDECKPIQTQCSGLFDDLRGSDAEASASAGM